ncbi:uncharacterized protein LOC131246250 isoform X2 [Magnolia sinica]|uniref:uncharacterized protein LOC131246250 isoform X2 n=1 Tax=Magnolia sinica TaxID=86752 RepID=UPI00265A1A6F|nr:uncharacterized protein LOC131246250 isoform X2 [Magnolia sinica]
MSNRLRYYKRDYNAVKDMLAARRFGWDNERMVVTAPDEVWEEYLRMGKDKYYVVLVRCHPGIYVTWDDARVEVEGFSGGRHRAFRNWNEAMACWKNYFGVPDQQGSGGEVHVDC